MADTPYVWHIAGMDAHLRIPSMLRLRERGVRIAAAGSADPEEFARHGIPYWPLPFVRGAQPAADRRTARQLRGLLEAERPDVVHAFSTKPGILVPAVARAAGVPAVVRTVCGLGYLFASSSPLARVLRIPYLALQRRACQAAHATVFQNTDDMECFEERHVVSAERSRLIPGSGVDLRQLRSRLPDETQRARLQEELDLTGQPVVTMVSRIVRHKGVVEYLEAARRVRAAHGDVRFLLVGPVETEGRQAVPRGTIDSFSDDVRYLEYRSDVPALLALSDVFVLPTYYREGVPRVLLEAAALGLGLVTTDMPGCRDVVLDGQTGFAVTPRDVDALVQAIGQLVESPELRFDLGSAALARIQERFEMARIVDAYIDLYGELLGGGVQERTWRAAA